MENMINNASMEVLQGLRMILDNIDSNDKNRIIEKISPAALQDLCRILKQLTEAKAP